MNQDKYVFAQLTAFLNRTQFNNFVRKYDGNRYVKQTEWMQSIWHSMQILMQPIFVVLSLVNILSDWIYSQRLDMLWEWK